MSIVFDRIPRRPFDLPSADRPQMQTGQGFPAFCFARCDWRKYRKRTKAGIFLQVCVCLFPECLRLTFSGLIEPRRAVLVHALHLYSLRPIPSARPRSPLYDAGQCISSRWRMPSGLYCVHCVLVSLPVPVKLPCGATVRARCPASPALRLPCGFSWIICAWPVDNFLLPVYKPVDNFPTIHHLPCG